MRQSHTTVVERNVEWRGPFESEPYEAAWASEAIFFVRTLAATGPRQAPTSARAQISPDGMHWCDEGTQVQLPAEPGVRFCRVRHFGGWLRLAGVVEEGDAYTVIVYLALKE